MPLADVLFVESKAPGFTVAQISICVSKVYSRLGKRYATPFGTTAPPLGANGTAPPVALLTGVPSLGSILTTVAIVAAGAVGTAAFQWSKDGGVTWMIAPLLPATGTAPPAVTVSGCSSAQLPSDLQVQITTAGALGTAAFRWSSDGGVTWTAAVLTASRVPLVAAGVTLAFPAGPYAVDNVYVGQGILTAPQSVLGTTGMTVTFPPGEYSTDNVYAAPPPVPEVVLGWVTTIITPDMYRKRGCSPADPQLELVEASRKEAWAEVKEAADSKEGLFDLPTNDATGNSAVTNGGPLGYTETSPYVGFDVQERAAYGEDSSGYGTGS